MECALGKGGAAVGFDAFEYFGTAGGCLPQLLRFLRLGARLRISTPALKEIRDRPALPPPGDSPQSRGNSPVFRTRPTRVFVMSTSPPKATVVSVT